ncbi:glycosyltransferase family 4 protein [Sphingomonas sp. R647]|uniref:glycosyltransferase family 4 protein n=1 Tax=Sphingomonas sp. R647 TaxID=2875233 RepID=UPI001CD4240A|nr:glycosyltransferase family 4 protein [Sphingomonas sp. R647]MCA1196345.1 glycosyltransferase family 4 protein [Sphingomonas sp. R647]
MWDDLALGLARTGTPCTRFVLYPPADPVAETVDFDAWQHIVEQKPDTLSGWRAMFTGLVRHLRATQPRAVVTSMPACNVIVPVAVTAARVSTRVFITHHSPAATHNPKLDRLDSWTGRLACVEAIVSVSDAVAASLAHKPAAYRAKSRTIRNALPEAVEAAIDRLRKPRPDGAPPVRIVALGRLTAQKNYPQLIDAMALVEGAELEIIGGGEDEAVLRTRAAMRCPSGEIFFSGHLPRERALAIAAAADIFVQISLYEGHSLALIEAARLGLPLVVSDVPEQVEAITAQDGTRCGIVVPLGDPQALARELNALAADPWARTAWSTLALRIAEEASNAAMIARYAGLLGLAQDR